MAQPGTGSTNQAQTISAFKKLAGKANTSAIKEFYEETIPSNVQITSKTIFGQAVQQTVSANSVDLYTQYSSSAGLTPTVEFVEFSVASIAGTDYDANTGSFGTTGFGAGDEAQSAGYHGYQLSLHADYNTSSSFSGKSTAPFSSSQVVHATNGTLQLISPSFGPQSGNNFAIQLYTSKGGSRIYPTDPIDWVMDYFNGVLYIQDYKASKVPTYAIGYIYTGKMVETVINDGVAGSTITVKDEGSNITTALASLDFVGTGVTAANSGNNVTVTVAGSIPYSRTTVANSMTASSSTALLGVTTTSNIEIRLAPAQSLDTGQYLTIKKEVSTSNTITISASGSQTIDGTSQIVLESPYGALNLYSDGASSYFIY